MKQLLIALAVSLATPLFAQEDDLFNLLDEGENEQITYATFKGTQLINAATNETPGEGVLQYVIAHRFGSFNDDYLYNFFGLDNAQVRMQLDYGITDRLNVGIGRSSFLKVADSFVKYKLIRQQSGIHNVPVSITLHSTLNYRNARYSDGIEHDITDRFSYMHQAIIARKWNRSFSTIISPSIVHFNLVPASNDPNTTAHLTLGARYKLTKRMALTGEGTLLSNREFSSGERFTTPIALGIDIETGGHVFQLHISNTRAMNAPYWMARNPYSVSNGGLFLGFNISRVFTIKE